MEIERRYAAVLHHVVKRMMEAVGSLLSHLLALPPPDSDASISERARPVVGYILYSIWSKPLETKTSQEEYFSSFKACRWLQSGVEGLRPRFCFGPVLPVGNAFTISVEDLCAGCCRQTG